MDRTPVLFASRPHPSVSRKVALVLGGVAFFAAILLWERPKPPRGWADKVLGDLNSPVSVSMLLLLTAAAVYMVMGLLVAHGRVAILYLVSREGGPAVASWAGSFRLNWKVLPCGPRVAIAVGEERSVNPNGMVHHRIELQSGGRSMVVRAYSEPSEESMSEMRRKLDAAGVTLTYRHL